METGKDVGMGNPGYTFLMAAKFFEEPGRWSQGMFLVGTDGKQLLVEEAGVRLDAGDVGVAKASLPGVLWLYAYTNENFRKCVKLAREKLKLPDTVTEDGIPLRCTLVGWNDEPQRTQEECLTLLKALEKDCQ